jgi:hypothetical protein
MINFGIGEGLAYKHDFNADMNRLQTNQILDDQAKINYENQVSLLGDQLQAKHLETTWDNEQQTVFLEGKVKELGTFVMQNPDYRSQPLLMRQYKTMMSEMQDNDFVRNSMNANTNYGMLVDYIAKNPGSENAPDIQAQLQAYENYNTTGSADGISENRKKYVFSSPDTFDPTMGIAAIYGKLQPKQEFISGKGFGATKTEVDETTMKSTANAILQGAEGYKYQRAWANMSESDKSLYGNDPVRWISSVGQGFTKASVDAGQQWQKAASSGSGSGSGGGSANAFSAFYNDYRKEGPGGSWYNANAKTLVPMSENGDYTVGQDGVMIQTIGVDGKPAFINLKSFAGQNVTIDPKSIGKGFNGAGGEPYATARIIVPITDEMVNGTTPILKNNSSWYEGWDAKESNDTENDPAYAGSVELVKDKDGNNTGMVSIRAAVPLYISESTVRAYDIASTNTSIAGKAEGLGINQMDAQNQMALLQAMGMNQFATMPDGSYIGQAANGIWYDANGNVVK